jgi:N-acetylglutamate synthase-like GNAT family acetyltransferase
MINYVLNPQPSEVNWQQISDLFQVVNWGYRPCDEIENSFKQSSHFIIVKNDDNIIGFGRTVDDGKYYALIVDVVIHPDFQGQSIGTTVVTELKDQLEGYEFVTLTAAPGKDGFYQKIGWKKQKSSYIWPKDEKQAEEHCE